MFLKSSILVLCSAMLLSCNIYTYTPTHPLFTEYWETQDFNNKKFDVLKKNNVLFYIASGGFTRNKGGFTLGLYYDAPTPKQTFITKVNLIVNNKIADTIQSPIQFKENPSFVNKQYIEGGTKLIFKGFTKNDLLREDVAIQIYFDDDKGNTYTITLPFEFKLVMQSV